MPMPVFCHPERSFASTHHDRLACTAKPERHFSNMSKPNPTDTVPDTAPAPRPATVSPMPKEIGGPKGPEPTRYGDWEQKGRCTDF